MTVAHNPGGSPGRCGGCWSYQDDMSEDTPCSVLGSTCMRTQPVDVPATRAAPRNAANFPTGGMDVRDFSLFFTIFHRFSLCFTVFFTHFHCSSSTGPLRRPVLHRRLRMRRTNGRGLRPSCTNPGNFTFGGYVRRPCLETQALRAGSDLTDCLLCLAGGRDVEPLGHSLGHVCLLHFRAGTGGAGTLRTAGPVGLLEQLAGVGDLERPNIPGRSSPKEAIDPWIY